MEMYLKITACLLLIVHAFHLASFQYTTDTPGRTIDGSWYRKLADNSAGGQNLAVTDGDAQYDWEADTTAMEPDAVPLL
ncbi:mucin-15 [Lates japonicus]